MWLSFAIIAACLWGLNYALTEKILHSISPMTLLAFEMLIGAVSFFCISYFFNLKKDVETLSSHPNLFIFVIIEIVVVLLANFFIVHSIQAKNATTAGIVELLYPLFTILFTWLIFRDNHLSLSVIIGGGLILSGVLVLQR